MGKTNAGGYYAVAKGHQIGIFNTWAECEANVKGYSGAKFKKFSTSNEAQEFVKQWAYFSCAAKSAQAAGRLPLAAASSSNVFTSKSSGLQTTANTARQFSSALNPSSSVGVQLEKVTKRKLDQEDRRIQVLDAPPPKYTTKRHRVDTPLFKKGIKSLDGEQVYLPFIVDENEFVNVYTDGACRDNGRSNPRAGVGVWFGDDHPLNISLRVDGPPTNNTAEIQAARLAIETAKEAGFEKLKINTDSAFLINCATQWLPKWKSNGWKLANGGDVKNRLELEKLDRAQQNITIYWNKVLAHSGIHGNEMADRLANEGAFK